MFFLFVFFATKEMLFEIMSIMSEILLFNIFFKYKLNLLKLLGLNIQIFVEKLFSENYIDEKIKNKFKELFFYF